MVAVFQKGVSCLKCGKTDCIQFPDNEGLSNCFYCGKTYYNHDIEIPTTQLEIGAHHKNTKNGTRHRLSKHD